MAMATAVPVVYATLYCITSHPTVIAGWSPTCITRRPMGAPTCSPIRRVRARLIVAPRPAACMMARRHPPRHGALRTALAVLALAAGAALAAASDGLAAGLAADAAYAGGANDGDPWALGGTYAAGVPQAFPGAYAAGMVAGAQADAGDEARDAAASVHSSVLDSAEDFSATATFISSATLSVRNAIESATSSVQSSLSTIRASLSSAVSSSTSTVTVTETVGTSTAVTRTTVLEVLGYVPAPAVLPPLREGASLPTCPAASPPPAFQGTERVPGAVPIESTYPRARPSEIPPPPQQTEALPADREYRHGVVAAEHEECSRIGVETLRRGGSAVDAAIAALLCIGVVHNHSSGIGGGGVMLVHARGRAPRVIDFREAAPADVREDMFAGRPAWATDSGLGVAVPGEVAGMAVAHRLYGRLPWAALFAPAIALAQSGFAVGPALADAIARGAERLRADAGLAAAYLRPDGTPKAAGDTVVRPALAQTLSRIAAEGPAALYGRDAPLARSICAAVQRAVPPGAPVRGLSPSDFCAYRVRLRPALRAKVGPYDAAAPGAPTGGPLVLQTLRVLARLGWRADDAASTQRLVEALKFAAGERARLGDPEHVRGSAAAAASAVSDGRVAEVCARITERTHDVGYYLAGRDAAEPPRDHGTTSVSAFARTPDGDWMAVGVASTVNLEWGAAISDPKSGVLLNNEMDDFATPGQANFFGVAPSRANAIAPGKRPQSSMAPLVLTRRGMPVLVAGGTGGSRIVSAVVQAVLLAAFGGRGALAAVSAPRLHHQLLPHYVMAEGRCDAAAVHDLQRRGHEVLVLGPRAFAASASLAVAAACAADAADLESAPWTAASDPRKGGVALGY